jgi:hypothetical protein
MRTVWNLPSNSELDVAPHHWFKSVLVHAPAYMIDTILLITWRAWYARNEVTHDKSLPSVESSKSFLCSYLRLIHNIKDANPDSAIKGEQLMVQGGSLPAPRQKKKGPDKPWVKPQAGWVKLSVDGSVRTDDQTAHSWYWYGSSGQ